MNNNNSTDNIDLAYSYTEDFLKDRKNEIKHLDWRLGTFLGFAGLLLRFGIDLPNSQPSYLLTKLGVLVASTSSVVIAAWGLRSNSKGKFVKPSYLMESECFTKETPRIKAMIINTHKETSDELDKLARQKQVYLRRAIACLAASTVFFAINGVLVAFFGK
jgi:hypothetical protein